MSTALPVYPITTDQYERFEGYPGLRDELIYGAIYLSPQAKPLPQQVASNISGSLVKTTSRGRIQTSGFARPPTCPSPDVFVVAKEDWKRACDTDDDLSNAPVLVVEILSPANRKKRVDIKIDVYRTHDVREIRSSIQAAERLKWSTRMGHGYSRQKTPSTHFPNH